MAYLHMYLHICIYTNMSYIMIFMDIFYVTLSCALYILQLLQAMGKLRRPSAPWHPLGDPSSEGRIPSRSEGRCGSAGGLGATCCCLELEYDVGKTMVFPLNQYL